MADFDFLVGTWNVANWEQAFSTDGERTWETNWVMEFTRASTG
ncbi:hypothetical protein AB0D32_32210 [Micromonospora sp. NPDC048170]